MLIRKAVCICCQGLEAEIRGRDVAVIGTNRAVNKIEVHHVTMLQDLRGRIVRCDGAISKHTKDIILLMEELKRLEGQVQGSRERTQSEIHRLEAEVGSSEKTLKIHIWQLLQQYKQYKIKTACC